MEKHQAIPLVDARPKFPASENSLWDKAREERDRIADLLDATIRNLGLLVWVRKSKPGEYPLYVLVDNWKPVEDTGDFQTTERNSLKIIIEVVPYKESPLSYTVTLKRFSKSWTASFWQLSNDDITEMAAYLVKGGSKPRFFKSKIDPIVAFVAAFVPPILYFLIPRNRTIKRARNTWFTIPKILGWGGSIAAIYFFVTANDLSQQYYTRDQVGYYQILAFVSAAFAALGIYWGYIRPTRYATPSQSFRTPRKEFLVDSWHVCVPDAGIDFADFEKRMLGAISALDSSIEINKEMHQKLSPRGFEERERHVLTKGQANTHVHIYPFGRNAFVGWDGYLNFAKWQETTPVSVHVDRKAKIEYRSLVAGVHIPSEFDLMELNVLTELVHRGLVREIKMFLKEKEIEADLDFQVIRGDRARALGVADEAAEPWFARKRSSYFSHKNTAENG